MEALFHLDVIYDKHKDQPFKIACDGFIKEVNSCEEYRWGYAKKRKCSHRSTPHQEPIRPKHIQTLHLLIHLCVPWYICCRSHDTVAPPYLVSTISVPQRLYQGATFSSLSSSATFSRQYTYTYHGYRYRPGGWKTLLSILIDCTTVGEFRVIWKTEGTHFKWVLWSGTPDVSYGGDWDDKIAVSADGFM